MSYTTTTLLLLVSFVLLSTLLPSDAARELASTDKKSTKNPPAFPWGGGFPGFGGNNDWWSFVPRNNGGFKTPTSMVCKEKGRWCYNKKLTCPSKCFHSWSKSRKNYGGGGGGGSCTIDCKKCAARC